MTEKTPGAERATLDSDIRAELDRMDEATQALAADLASKRAAMDVCISTRAALATFLDLARWSGRIDEVARRVLLEAFQESHHLLLQTDKHSYRKSVATRIDELKAFRLDKVTPNLTSLD